ncbi:hypothetical protein ABOM_001135 [Aspergillus bombycis]|uniref:Uncharacterized protein n=1 Tax=Aspergillus bombycis TaxID=109264 RepID=A0A1F8AFH0_9EURO|nr:hypothetical protein ABOM_001135 [Aspergillus bombycis]OGM50149.1 hypothetical protein ABOM_001135 [Aspergillus bombycis]
MVPGSSSALKASRGVTSKVLASPAKPALSGETHSKSGASHSVQGKRPSVPSRGNEKDGKVDRPKETSPKQPAVPIKPRTNERVSTTQTSMESKPPTAPKHASPGIPSESPVGHSEPQQADADSLTTFPPFAVGPRDKVKRFLESQGLGDPSDTPPQSAVDQLRSRPPTPWPGAGADPESLHSVDDALPPVPSHQVPRVPTTEDKPPLRKSTASKKPGELCLKDLRISQPDMPSHPLPSLPASRFNFLPSEDDLSIIDDPGLLTPITEVPSELSRANSPVDPLTASYRPRPIVEQPDPPVKKPPVQKPVDTPTPQPATLAAREVPKPRPPPASTALSSIPDRPGTPQVTVGLPKPKQKTPAGSARPDLASAKKLERKPSKLNITTTSSAMESDSRRQSEKISEAHSDEPKQRLSSPFNPCKTGKQAWDLETIASEDSWFQENEESDGSVSGESGPRRTPPGPVRARLTVETVECTLQPPAQTPDLDLAQYDATGQARSEFFPPWAVGSQALSEGARDLRT